MPTFHLLIKGKVQGVFYRAAAKEAADKIGITGWISNTEESDVEAIVTGNEANLNAFIEWCKVGSARSKVFEVIATEQKEAFFKDFAIKRNL